MGSLSNLALGTEVDTTSNDTLGGTQVIPSNLYNAVISVAYLGKSKGGATSVTVDFKTETGADIQMTEYITSGTVKGCKPTYERKGKLYSLPGYSKINDLCLLTTGKKLSDLDSETKVVNIYNFDQKAKVPTKTEVIMDLVGKSLCLGVLHTKDDKRKKNDKGEYVSTGEIREFNEVDKLFRDPDQYTIKEINDKAPKSVFAHKWLKKWRDEIKDISTGINNFSQDNPITVNINKTTINTEELF